MKSVNYYARIHDSIDNYYRYNPDTLMPLFMVALATQGKLQVSTSYSGGATLICEIQPEKVRDYEWVCLDDALKERIEKVNHAKQTYTVDFTTNHNYRFNIIYYKS